MSGIYSMLGGIWTSISDFITGIFALIPQYLYFFYTCIASILDLFQFVLRKLVGLDSYYVNGVETEGDLLSRFIDGILGLNGSYSALNTVFWSLVIFGAIILVVGLIMSLIKAHYNYDAKKSNPTAILGKGLKSIATFAIVPLVTIFGVYLSNVLLKALDSITAYSSAGNTASVYANSTGNYQQVFKSDSDEWGNETYLSYDFFGSHAPTASRSFSGMLFQVAAHDANRVRYGAFTASKAGDAWSDCGIFNSKLSSDEGQTEDVANMIDYAFVGNLSLSNAQTASVLKEESMVLMSSFRYFSSAVWYLGTINFDNFSKYNVGLVWYYYNLWSFNFLMGFLGIIICITLLFNIVFGLIVRLIEGTALFLVVGPIVAIMPLDDGKAFKDWRKKFVGDILMGYGAIIGINLLFMVLPYLQNITFFSSKILNSIMDLVFVIVGLLATKQIITLISNLIGATDAYSVGEEVKKEAGKLNPLTVKNIATVALVGAKVAKLFPAAKVAAQAVEKVAKKVRDREVKKAQAKKAQDGQAKVSRATHEAIRKEQLDGLQQQKDELKDLEDEQRKLATSENQKADKAEESANTNEEKANEDAAKFESWLRSNSSEPYETDSVTDQALAGMLKKDFDNLNAANEEIVTDPDAEGYGSVMSDEEKEKLREQHIKEMVEAYKERSSFTRSAGADRISAEQHRNNAREAEAKADDYKAQIEGVDKQIEDTKNADVLDGYQIKQHKPIPKNTLNHLLRFNGESIKAIGRFMGFDELLEKMNKETQAVDKGKMVIREFGQVIGANGLSGVKMLRTQEEKDEIKKAARLQKVSTNVGVQESQNQYQAVSELAEVLKKLKKS